MEDWLRHLAGSHRCVLNYLMEQVFRRQPADVRGFLLSSSILDRFTGSPCDAVCEGDTGQDTLLALEQANLFLVPLDESRLWYRYHRLFGDVLRHRLQAERKAQVPELHRRASRWYATHGYTADAVRHALAACDWDNAADLILGGTSSELLKRGELMTLLGWFRAFPEPVMRASPRLCCEYAWPLMLTGQIESADSYIGQARATDNRLVEQFLRERAHPSRRLGGEPASPSANGLAELPPDRLPGRDLILLNLGMSRWYQGRLAEAEEILEEAKSAARQPGAPTPGSLLPSS